MNHSFIASIGRENDKCAKCHYDFLAHTALAHCDACDYVGECELMGSVEHGKSLLLCPSCIQKEIDSAVRTAAIEQSNGTAYERNTIDTIDSIAKAMKIDQSIRWHGDFFNAATVPIVELQSLIDSDESITNKPLAMAEAVKDRYLHFQKALFDLREHETQLQGTLIAHQQYLNQLVSKLRLEERAKFKENDINYKPVEAVKPKAIAKKQTLEEKQIERYAKLMKISEEQAAKIMREMGLL